MSTTTSLPSTITSPRVRHESQYGTLELKGVFLWIGAALVLGVIL